MTYKVCIKAAGKGTRVSHAQSTNKALLPVGEKSALSHIVDKFPMDIEIVVAVGHNAQLIKDFAGLAYPNRKFVFVDVDQYEEEGSGPGYSLLCCRPYLQCPFIFFACDTLVLEDIPELNENWIGVSSVTDSLPYLVSEVTDHQVERFHDKIELDQLQQLSSNTQSVLDHAFIGLAGVKDHEAFWQGLEEAPELIRNERQISGGLNALIPKGLVTVPFTWFDLGTDELYEQAIQQITGSRALIKPDEFTYIEGENVIKFFAVNERVQARARRARLLKGVVPELQEIRDHFLAYGYVQGQLLSDVLEDTTFVNFLDFVKENLWIRKRLDPQEQHRFSMACHRFYFDKTWERIGQFFMKTGISDKPDVINGARVPSISSMFERLDWNWLCMGDPVLMHGDPQPENVIVGDNGMFYLIDWREDFGGIQEYGDIYYDLAKIYHALTISGEIVRGDEFVVDRHPDRVTYNFRLKNNLLQFKSIFEDFITNRGCDIYKVKMLSAIIYLNIAPLHHEPYSYLLYYHGKHILHQLQEERG